RDELRHEIGLLWPQFDPAMGEAHESGRDVEAQARSNRGSGAQQRVRLDDSIERNPIWWSPLAQSPEPAPGSHRGDVARGVGALKTVPVDQGEPLRCHQDVPRGEIPMGGHQLEVLDPGRFQRSSQLPERTCELRSELGDTFCLALHRPDDSSRAPSPAWVGIALMKRCQQPHSTRDDGRVQRAYVDQRAAWKALHDDHPNIRQIVDWSRKTRWASSFAE